MVRSTSKKTMLAASLVAVAAFISPAWGQAKNAKQTPKTTKSIVAKPARPSVKPLTVNEIAEKPSDHLGRIAVVGVVASVNEKRGFLLIDTSEFKECGLACLTEAATKKIPVRWSGAAPKVKETVRVEGRLEKKQKGYIFTAEKINKP